MVDALTGPVVRVLASGHPAYPRRLHHLPDPPAPLYVRGDLACLGRPCVAVVGSRRSTEYGRRAARELARVAASAGWTVVSGMALGIDGAAHRGALEGGGGTVAVLGSGPDVPSPRSHARLMNEILASGAVLSEYAPGTEARPHHFPRRNRILAALAHRVVVVEAALRSGALITAREALELGREVWAVPGSIFSPGTPGTHALLEDGAVPVASMEGWAASLQENPAGGTVPTHPTAPGVPLNPPSTSQLPLGLDGEGVPARVLDALGREAKSLEDLLAEVRATPAELLAALSRLELGGWVERAGGSGCWRRAA